MRLFVKALSALDISWWCPTRGLAGASYHVDVELEGEPGEDGMLFDFGEVKPWIKSHIDDGIDHTLVVPTQAPGVDVIECSEGLCLTAHTPWHLVMRAPRQAFTLLPWPEITAERLGDHIAATLMKRLPPRVEQVRIFLREETLSDSGYTYSHGLRRHQGNCQRIAHGHRSNLLVYQNGERSEQLERYWSKRLADIYLADCDDVVDTDKTPRNGDDPTSRCRIAYRAPQGRFLIELPRSRVEILPCATTVERIADWIATQSAEMVGGRIQVHAFEGINKGAVATARRR